MHQKIQVICFNFFECGRATSPTFGSYGLPPLTICLAKVIVDGKLAIETVAMQIHAVTTNADGELVTKTRRE